MTIEYFLNFEKNIRLVFMTSVCRFMSATVITFLSKKWIQPAQKVILRKPEIFGTV